MSEMEEKLEGWFPIVNPRTWQIFRLLENGPLYIRELRNAGFTGSPATIQKYIDQFEEFGFLKTWITEDRWHKRMVKLTDSGRDALEHIDALGELVKKARE